MYNSGSKSPPKYKVNGPCSLKKLGHLVSLSLSLHLSLFILRHRPSWGYPWTLLRLDLGTALVAKKPIGDKTFLYQIQQQFWLIEHLWWTRPGATHFPYIMSNPQLTKGGSIYYELYSTGRKYTQHKGQITDWGHTTVSDLSQVNQIWERVLTPVFWLWEFHGLYSSPWSRKVSDTTEQLSLHFTSIKFQCLWLCWRQMGQNSKLESW